ncbi:MAG TPA: hypothetical protein VD997_01075 [Phycisphaerales bacterium]|nr:hypothetical protein [Phycisphaerales bacterium]
MPRRQSRTAVAAAASDACIMEVGGRFVRVMTLREGVGATTYTLMHSAGFSEDYATARAHGEQSRAAEWLKGAGALVPIPRALRGLVDFGPERWDYNVQTAGWPVECLRQGRVSVRTPSGPQTIDVYTMEITWRGRTYRLPREPLLPGFALNTAFYAIAALGVVEALAFARRRTRAHRGRCEACGYDRGGIAAAAACPECGAAQ